MEVNGPAKYRLVNTPFGDVIVSSDGNNPAAFYNKSMHRGHQLIQSKRFEGDLICPYHGWHYDSKGGLVEPGVLANIPGDQKFYGIGRHDYNGKSIQNLAAARVGDLVFINAGEKPSPIERQFKPHVIEALELSRDKLGDIFLEVSIELKFNWKLIFENLRDGLHPLYLHKETLNKEVDFSFIKSFRPSQRKTIENIDEISSFSRDGFVRNIDAPHTSNFEKLDDKNMYLNWLLFPYTHIASPDGCALLGIENYVPISVHKTRLDLTLCITRSHGRASPIPILHRWFQKSSMVFKEDFDAVESIQRNSQNSRMSQHLGMYENRNISIAEWMEKEIYAK